MKIAVLVKQVPSRESPLRLSADGTWFDEAAVSFEMNESDGYALEEALRLKDAEGGNVEILVLSLGPERVQKTLRDALARGADRAVHILEEPPLTSDPHTIAGLFATVLRDEACDLVLSGLQSDDLGMGQTGVILGELLGMATTTLVVATDLKGTTLRVKRELEARWFQWLELSLPAALGVQTGINRPRYPNLKGIMGAKKKPVTTLARAELSVGEPLQRTLGLFVQKKDKRTEIIEGTPDQAATRLAEVLKNEIKVL